MLPITFEDLLYTFHLKPGDKTAIFDHLAKFNHVGLTYTETTVISVNDHEIVTTLGVFNRVLGDSKDTRSKQLCPITNEVREELNKTAKVI
jgi:hypothetical protein